MGKNTRPIPNSSAKKILEHFGAKRVSAEAAEEMVFILEDIANEISKKAIELAKHSGRKTVQEEDIKLAAKLV